MQGSLQNRLAENTEQMTPQVGMGVTVFMWSDRHAGTIVGMSESGKTIEFTMDTATRTDDNGFSHDQKYSYKTNLDAPRLKARQNKKGQWKILNHGSFLGIGFRSEYYDIEF